MATIVGAMVMAAPAYASQIYVFPGQSIQAAVDSATPGDKVVVMPGKYHQIVEITTDGITLTTFDPNKHNTILLPPASGENGCSRFAAAGGIAGVSGGGGTPGIGICVHGSFTDGGTRGSTGPSPVDGVTVEGFAVKNFGVFGVIGLNTSNYTVNQVLAVNDGEYGITAFESSGVTFTNNETSYNEIGIYMGDSPVANLWASKNESHHNGLGMFIRNTSYGQLLGNNFHSNCVGVLLDAGEPGPVSYWLLRKNQANSNNADCGFVSGAGIFVGGADHTTLFRNEVDDNGSNGAGLAGGILVGKNSGFVPNHDLIKYNNAIDNVPYDLLWDGTGSRIRFVKNVCDTSQPPGLC
jgi:parallel beta-helix repeat protein